MDLEFETIRQQEKDNLMPTYSRFPVALASGKGAVAKSCDGREYVDFTSGIGVNALGYCDDGWVKAVSQQAATLQHVSNLYYQPVQIQLAETLCRLTGFSKVFFGNSGAEANECAIKLARKYSRDAYGEGRAEIVTLRNSFHGRTVTTLAATGQDGLHTSFAPFTEGFQYAEAPTMEAVGACVSEKTCAVMIELIQGEGGVIPLPQAFVTALRDYCRQKDLLLLIDEVQTGVGRTGALYAFQKFGIMPDVITTAKGLGGGLPIGACLCGERLAGVMSAGTHGSTFGGNPVACAGALEVLSRVSDPGFLRDVEEKGAYLRARLEAMQGITEVRGMGMMLGAVLAEKKAGAVVAQCVEEGLLLLTAKDKLRFLPPLTISYGELARGLAILESVLKQ